MNTYLNIEKCKLPFAFNYLISPKKEIKNIQKARFDCFEVEKYKTDKYMRICYYKPITLNIDFSNEI